MLNGALPMHVLFIPSWYPAQSDDIAGSFFREQALALQGHGMQIGVITPAFRSLTRWRAIRGGYGFDAENDNGLHTLRYHGVRAFSWSHAMNIRFWERTGLRAFDDYQRRVGRPDVLHVHAMIFGLAWAAAIHREHGIPFVVTEHSSEFVRSPVRIPLLNYLTNQVSQAHRAFAVSSSLGKVLDFQVPLREGRTWEVMPNMVSSRFGLSTRNPFYQNGRGAPLRLLSVGSMDNNKGVHHLLRAMFLAIGAGENCLLRVCGSGPQLAALKALRFELGLDNRVEFLGHCSREQVSEEMLNATALVVSSSNETFGVVVVEALLSGRPVLSTRCGGPEDIIVEGRDGYLVDKDSPAALSAGLRRLASELDHFDPQDIRQRCIERFSDSAFASRHAQVYSAIMASTSKPAEA
ncbi:D-inositol-3-phosphate glycosyltransferase [Comamonadaceae bacterium OS-4]|nr:D-inositol-3-phosphate glycosyltransferase [Comamonadaceae bacterium OS-4]